MNCFLDIKTAVFQNAMNTTKQLQGTIIKLNETQRDIVGYQKKAEKPLKLIQISSPLDILFTLHLYKLDKLPIKVKFQLL